MFLFLRQVGARNCLGKWQKERTCLTCFQKIFIKRPNSSSLNQTASRSAMSVSLGGDHQPA